MKINKKSMVLYLFIVLLIIYSGYKTLNQRAYQLPSKAVLHLDTKIFESYTKNFPIDKEFNAYWGFAKEKQKNVLQKDTNATRRVQIAKETGKNILCIDASCYRLLAIHNGKVTLYNKDLSQKMKDYGVDDILSSAVIIKSIQTHTVVLKEINATKTYKFKLFDVNQTKYKPKELKNEQE